MTYNGSLYYAAPEMLSRSYKMSCDLWSLGVVAYSLLTGDFPYTAEFPMEML